MSSNLKWPAYAKRLFEDRARGKLSFHRIDVYFGVKWPREPMAPVQGDPPWLPYASRIYSIGIPLEEYAPGVFDLRVLAGVACKLHWSDRVPERGGYGLELWLAGECARYADWVEMDPEYEPTSSIHSLAWLFRTIDPQGPRFVWPPWMSQALHDDYRRRREAWWQRHAEALIAWKDAESACSAGVRGSGGRRHPAEDRIRAGGADRHD